MLKRIASLATAAALFLLALGGLAGGQTPADSPSDQATEPSPRTEEAAPADSARGGEEEEPARPDAGSAETEETTSPADPEASDEATDEEPGGVAPSGLQVFRAYICKGIEQSEPTEAGKSFIPTADGVLRLCCFSEIAGAAGPDSVYHVWYWGEREMARVPLRVDGARWRTWSAKRIVDEWRGDWRVDIVDGDGFVLKRLTFSVE